jgi:hypothetical protein
MRAIAASLSASKRITTTGVVFDGLAKPNPSAYSTRTPSIVLIDSEVGNLAFALIVSSNANGSPSAQGSCSSGVQIAFGKSLSVLLGFDFFTQNFQ